GLPKLPGGWMALDKAKLTGDNADLVGFYGVDPANASPMFSEGLTQATQAADGSYQGTLDLTKASDADVVDSDQLTALGDQAKAVPFQAAVDSAHRLTSVTVDVPAAGSSAAFKYQVSYTGYGAPEDIDAPAANQVQPATDAAYSLLNG